LKTEEEREKEKNEEKEKEDGKDKNEVKGCSNPEILAVLGHELGHWQMNHVAKNIVISQVKNISTFLILCLVRKTWECLVHVKSEIHIIVLFNPTDF